LSAKKYFFLAKNDFLGQKFRAEKNVIAKQHAIPDHQLKTNIFLKDDFHIFLSLGF